MDRTTGEGYRRARGQATSRGRSGLNWEVAVVGTTAVVGSGFPPFAAVRPGFGPTNPCKETRTKLVDLSDATRPTVVGHIVIPGGVNVMDVDAISVDTPAFTGDLAALALQRCGVAPGGFNGTVADRSVAYAAGPSAELFAGGTKVVFPYLDDAVYEVDATDPSAPSPLTLINPYEEVREVEGNGARATMAGPAENLALLAEEDWIAPRTSLRIDSPASSPQGLTAGSTFGCEAMFTLFDPEDTAQIYRHEGSQVPAGAGASAEFGYVGRGCPGDAYLNDAGGNPVDDSAKIAGIDNARSSRQTGQLPSAGCTFSAKVLRAQEAGAIGVVIDPVQNSAGVAISIGGDPAGIAIPVMAVDPPLNARLRDTLCSSTVPAGRGNRIAGTAVTGAMVNEQGAWGGLRVVDFNAGSQVGRYDTPLAHLPPARPRRLLGPPRGGRRRHRLRGLELRRAAHPGPERPHPTERDRPLRPARPARSLGFRPAGQGPRGRRRPGPRLHGGHLDVHTGLYVLADPTCTPGS